MPADVEKTARKQLERLKQMAAVLGRIHRAAHLPRVAGGAALVEADRRSRWTSIRRARSSTPITTTCKKVKKRILEYLAVRKLAPGKKGPILCLVGPARRRQDVAGQVDRPLAGTRVHPRLAGRRARRGRGPRPPAHVHRRAARPDHPGHAPGGHAQPGVHARRDRQAGRRFPRRPVGGAARGAGPGAELDVLGPLPRGQLRPVRRHLHRDGEHAGHRSRRRCSTAWRCSRSRATPAKRSWRSPSATWCRSRSRSTASTTSKIRFSDDDADHAHRAVHARGRAFATSSARSPASSAASRSRWRRT